MNAIVQVEQQALAVQAPVVNGGPLSHAMAAIQSGMGKEQLELLKGFMALQNEWEANEAKKAYAEDMADFKLKSPPIPKDKLVGYANKDGTVTGYYHATLGGISDAVVGPLATYGFSHSWETKQAGGDITVTCTLKHRKGHTESNSMSSGPDSSGKKNAIQAVASSITYLQRYTLLGVVGLSTKDIVDDDGAGGGSGYNSAEEVLHWLDQVNAAQTPGDVDKIRAPAFQAFKNAQDYSGWDRVKDAAVAKKKALEGVAA